MNDLFCDPIDGSCRLPDVVPVADSVAGPMAKQLASKAVLRYIGDPMCSWCWGISPELEEVARYCDERGIGFTLTMGGLRAGGGDPWTAEFRVFLRREWTHISQVTGQPFGFSLLQAAHFDYDTEPACRAVLVAEGLLALQGAGAWTVLAFFSAVQRKFYVCGADPKNVEFYRSICVEASIPYDEFCARFASATAKHASYQQFAQCRTWGVRAFPTLLLEVDDELTQVSSGAVRASAVIGCMENVLKTRKGR